MRIIEVEDLPPSYSFTFSMDGVTILVKGGLDEKISSVSRDTPVDTDAANSEGRQ